MYELIRAKDNIVETIMKIQNNIFEGPDCGSRTDNYVQCFTLPDDIDDTEFILHPVTTGTILGDLKGTPDYDLGLGMMTAIRDGTFACDDVGSFKSVEFPWLFQDAVTPITATVLSLDFEKDGKRHVCASGPLIETFIDPLAVTEPTKMHDLIPEFVWDPAPDGADYDFEGNLEFCGGKANEVDWPEYFLDENVSGAIFAYRQLNRHQGLACGDEMAPLIHLEQGKRYKINFINTSESDTNLHTHGLHLGGNGWSDDVFRLVPAGMCGVYFWEIAPDHMSGMHWYHPHLHGMTFEQVRGRAFGPLFIDEMPERVATYPPSVAKWLESTILLQMSVETVPSPMTNGDGVKDGRCAGGYENCYPRVNNKRKETVYLVENEWTSLVFNNVVPGGTGMDVIKFYDANGDGPSPCETLIAGYDGVYRTSVPRPEDTYPEESGLFHINGASRLMLAMKCSATATMKLAKFDSNDFHYGLENDIEAHMVPILIDFITIPGETTEASPYADEGTLTPWIPPRPDYLLDLTEYEGPVETWDIVTRVDMSTGVPTPLFNEQSFHGGEANAFFTYNAVQEWSYHGSAAHPDGHPMHVHVNHVQIYGHSNTTGDGTDCGSNLEYGQWYDTIRIKEEDWDPCVARFRFINYSGKIIMHCHDLLHEDGGMMGWVMVEGGPQDGDAFPQKEPIDCINIL